MNTQYKTKTFSNALIGPSKSKWLTMIYRLLINNTIGFLPKRCLHLPFSKTQWNRTQKTQAKKNLTVLRVSNLASTTVSISSTVWETLMIRESLPHLKRAFTRSVWKRSMRMMKIISNWGTSSAKVKKMMIRNLDSMKDLLRLSRIFSKSLTETERETSRKRSPSLTKPLIQILILQIATTLTIMDRWRVSVKSSPISTNKMH